MQFKLLAALSCSLLAAFVSAETGKLGDAVVIYDNPTSATFVATLPVNGSVTGTAKFTTAYNGTGVECSINFKGFKTVVGPFTYHIHDQPVPSSGNCNGTLAHLDPYQRGQATPCNPAFPATCEVGDLAGKHGKIPASNGSILDVNLVYTDNYISTKPGIGAFIGNRSIVVHNAAGSRIACANLSTFTGSPSGPNAPSYTAPLVSAGASTIALPTILGFAALMFAIVL